MKKTFILSVTILLGILLVSCQKQEALYPTINVGAKIVTIEFMEQYDLLENVKAYDEIDGDITSKIIVESDGFDVSIPRIYEITFTVTNSSGNTTSKTKQIGVLPRTTYSEGYSMNEIFKGIIENEKQPPTDHKCFPGDWSRKAESSFDKWLGMEGTIILPEFIGDPDRFGSLPWGYDSFLDNPSIYFGGNAGAESDVGLSWDIGVLPNGTMSKEKIAFRPIWRYIHRGENIWRNADDNDPYKFYYPGDKLRISVFSPEVHRLQLKIEVIEVTKIQKYVDIRKEYGINYPHDFLSEVFPSIGHGIGNARFMRVNAIDQYFNEGLDSKPTNAVVTAAVWEEVYLYRKIEEKIYKVPFNSDRYLAANCPVDSAFTIDYKGINKDNGGEIVTIHPGKK